MTFNKYDIIRASFQPQRDEKEDYYKNWKDARFEELIEECRNIDLQMDKRRGRERKSDKVDENST